MAQTKMPATFVAGIRFLVRLAGIEPTTPWFVAKYSIQLSYSRVSLKL
jgi:transcription elongation factor GreB